MIIPNVASAFVRCNDLRHQHLLQLLNEDSVINAFIACVLGGFQTFYGPVIGAYIIAIATNLLSYYVSSVWEHRFFICRFIIFIVFKPVGLIGKKL